jgi:hypothetical protein
MTDKLQVHKVTVQIRPPKGTFPGEVAVGYYVVFENCVIMTDEDGKPISGVAKHHLGPGEDARLVACRLVRNNRKGSTGFNRPLQYPKWVY